MNQYVNTIEFMTGMKIFLMMQFNYLFHPKEVSDYLLLAIVTFVGLTLVFFVALLISRSLSIRAEKKKARLMDSFEDLVSVLLFSNKRIADIIKERKVKVILSSKFSKRLFLEELLSLRTNLKGDYSERIREFYISSGLIKLSYKRFRSWRWHIKCKGIRELTLMEIKDIVPKLLKLSNAKNKFIRQEAQCSLLFLEGFSGLKFLDVLTEPMDEWQQINLVSVLSKQSANDFINVDRWMKGSNKSVTIFVLRLVMHFRYTITSDSIRQCLKNESDEVKLACIGAMKVLYNDDLSYMLMEMYVKQSHPIKIAILETLFEIGGNECEWFLVTLLTQSNYQIRFNAAKVLNRINDDLMIYKLNRLFRNDEELRAIFSHLTDGRIYA